MIIPKEYPTKILEKNKIAKDTYEIKLARPKNFDYGAGQYMILRIKSKISPPVRALSLSSSPNNKEFLSTCFRFSENPSDFKKNLIEKEFDVIIRGPLGKFTLPNTSNKPIIMIAGGVGIVPYVGMLTYLQEKKSNQKVKLIYTDKSEDKMAYLNELKELEKENKNFSMITKTKRVDKKFLKENCDLKNSIFYVCGGKTMVEDVATILKELGIPEENLMLEKY